MFMTRMPIILLVYLLPAILASGDVTVTIFGDGDAAKDVFPVAFTDYDGDKRTDLVVLTKNLSSFRIYFGSPNSPSLRFQPEFQCDIMLHNNFSQITGLNLADFTGDGVNDVLVTFKYPEDQSGRPNGTFVSIFKGGLKTLACEALILNGKSTSAEESKRLNLIREPLIVDVNGDMIADLVGETLQKERKIWIFRHDLQPPLENPFGCNGNGECLPIKTGGFVDVDGDFTPDLVLVTESKNENPKDSTIRHKVEIYDPVISDRGHGQFKFRKNISIDFPIGQMGSALFLDLDLSGQEHAIVLPFCQDKKCKTSGFALVDVTAGQVHHLNVPFGDNLGNVWRFPSPSFHTYLQTINVRAGDYNLDGYPDLIATLVTTKKSSSETESRSVLFKNVPCQRQGGSCVYPRTFEPNFSLLNSYSDVLSTAFYDSNENGLLDIMGLRRTSKQGPASNETYTIFVQENYPEYDAYFVRWIIISGLCEINCPAYGVMLPGGTMKYSTINVNNQIQSSRASQVFRTGFPLDLPGSLMGTGASANFIDTIIFGGTLGGSNFTRNQIIPNSNLISIPWRKNQNGGKEIKWEMKQILRPKDGGIMATFHVLLVICCINASLVIYLHMKERKMDRIERHRDPVSMSALTMT